MKAALFHKFGGTEVLQIEEIAPPRPAADEVLVKVRAAAVNPKDTFIRKGRFAEWSGNRFPMQTGFDFAGEVAQVGAQVQGVEKGLAVFGMLDGWAGRTCAEWVAAKPHQMSAKPASLTYEEAAALPLVCLTALQALRGLGAIRAESRVCINGASGGVGSMAVQIAKLLGARVTAISSQVNHARLKRLGADICLDYHQVDIAAGGEIFDIFFDVFGNQPFATIQPLLTETGTWISTVVKAEVLQAVAATEHSKGQKAKLVIVQANHKDLAQICQWAENGQLQPIIHAVFQLDQIAAAHRQQETKHTHGKLVITIP
ncbi:MAG: NAD(P)-dependent alcohol dehydrogenase [Desulfobacteraceae bacterium]|nr:NAD(P)-dependent alcohol dehydrogenase [Desulfobacteraceae bacterium]